jgi:hypothetical protein
LDDYSSFSTWQKANDPCPSGWRVPTVSELKSLINSGYINNLTGLTFGSASNTVFFPADGYGVDYWSSSPYGSSEAYSLYCFDLTEDRYDEVGTVPSIRSEVMQIRCVAE